MRACHTVHRRAQDGPRDQPAFAEGSKPEAAGREMARTTQPPAPVAGARSPAALASERGPVPRPAAEAPHTDMGEEWDFDDDNEMSRRLPKLTARLAEG